MEIKDPGKPFLVDVDYRFLVESMTDMVLWLGENGRILYSNAAATQMSGYLAEELQSKTLYQLLKADKRSATKKFFEAQLAAQTSSFYLELPLLTKSSAITWLGCNFVYHHNGESPAFICTARDINEKIRAELLKENWMSRLLVLIENLQEGILMVDENRKITLVNRTFCDLFSVRLIPEDLIGRNYVNAQNHVKQMFTDPELFVTEEEDVINNMMVLVSQRLDLLNGRVYERDYVPIYIETGYAGGLWKYRDTTEKTRIKTELIKSEKKYRSVIEAMNLGLMEVGRDDKILNVNDAFCLMLGYTSAGELIGKPSFDTLLDKEDQEKMRQEMASRKEGDSSTYEIKARRGDGGYSWLLINGAQLYDENNNVTGSVGIHLDITYQKRIAIELEEKRAMQNLMEWQEKAMQTLEEKVQERTVEVVKQKQIIENKNLEITKSINYALRIQQSLLPGKEELNAAFTDNFILYLPKDIVSGDFYYLRQQNQSVWYVSAADSTGHGVPGGFMSMLGTEKLNEAVLKEGSPGEILAHVNASVKNTLRNSESRISLLDGFDISMCRIDFENLTLDFAGALRPLWLIRNGETTIHEIKGTRRSIGGRTDVNQHFETHRLQIKKGDCVYLFTDGYTDQFSPAQKRLSTRRFAEVLKQNASKSMMEQQQALLKFLNEWKNNKSQTDDILVLGIKI